MGRRLARAPIWLYRARLGWCLGPRFVLVEHTGRASGKTRQTVLEVIARDGLVIDVAAAWPSSDWFLNLQADHHARVSTGRRRRIPMTATVLERADAEQVLRAYAEQHRLAARALTSALGLPLHDPAALSRTLPVVEFRPA